MRIWPIQWQPMENPVSYPSETSLVPFHLPRKGELLDWHGRDLHQKPRFRVYMTVGTFADYATAHPRVLIFA